MFKLGQHTELEQPRLLAGQHARIHKNRTGVHYQKAISWHVLDGCGRHHGHVILAILDKHHATSKG